jgi:hypothetical protein
LPIIFRKKEFKSHFRIFALSQFYLFLGGVNNSLHSANCAQRAPHLHEARQNTHKRQLRSRFVLRLLVARLQTEIRARCFYFLSKIQIEKSSGL